MPYPGNRKVEAITAWSILVNSTRTCVEAHPIYIKEISQPIWMGPIESTEGPTLYDRNLAPPTDSGDCNKT